jgi:hypothetical protein
MREIRIWAIILGVLSVTQSAKHLQVPFVQRFSVDGVIADRIGRYIVMSVPRRHRLSRLASTRSCMAIRGTASDPAIENIS